MMTERRVRHAPVVGDGGLQGIVSIGDVVKIRIGELETERTALTNYITGPLTRWCPLTDTCFSYGRIWRQARQGAFTSAQDDDLDSFSARPGRGASTRNATACGDGTGNVGETPGQNEYTAQDSTAEPAD